jgi:hypothetical protein
MDYSRPEMATERRICGRIRARVLRDPCAFCRNRVSGWGASTCNTPGKTFPMCTKRGSPAFDPDFELIDETMRKAA